MLTLPNVATQDKYVDACTLGPVPTTQQIVFVVANAAVYCQIARQLPNGTIGDWGDEILLTPQSNVVQRAGGIRFRSAVAGVSAQVIAQLIEPADPVPGAGTPFTAKLAASGSVTPGTAAVQVQKDGALIGTEVTLDFVTGNGQRLTMADDAANTRVTIRLDDLAIGSTIAALNAYYGGAPPNGARGMLTLNTGGIIDVVMLTYNSTVGKWVSDPFKLYDDAANTYNTVGAKGTAGGGLRWRPFIDAGLGLAARLSGFTSHDVAATGFTYGFEALVVSDYNYAAANPNDSTIILQASWQRAQTAPAGVFVGFDTGWYTGLIGGGTYKDELLVRPYVATTAGGNMIVRVSVWGRWQG